MTSHDAIRDRLNTLGRQVRPAEDFTAEVVRRLGQIADADGQGADDGAVGAAVVATGSGTRAASGQGRQRRLWRAVASAAAVAALLTLAAWLTLPDKTALAWADVVEAMGRVKHLHVTVVKDDPRRADESKRLVKIELYYHAPGRWRVEGLGHVQFVHGKNVRLYNAEKRKFIDPAETRFRLVPPEILAALGEGDLLGAVLTSIFDGKPPEGQPVKSDAGAGAEGIEVFDYARDPTRQWVRIWVLKKSRLPMRIKLFEPRANESMLVAFDYSDPQPASYFDADHFERAIKESRLTRPYQILRAGAGPVGDKPTDAGHVHEMLGAYKAAKIVKTAGDANGAIMIEHAVPGNVAPRGGHIVHEGFAKPTDNWGNTYHSTGGIRFLKGHSRSYYVPMPAFKRGEGQRIVTLKYTIELRVPTKGKSISHEFLYRVLKTEGVPIGLDTADRVPEKARAEYWSRQATEEARGRYLRSGASAMVKWRYVQDRLAKKPNDLPLLCWSHSLLYHHGRKEEARALAAERILPLFLADPVKHYSSGWTVGRHLEWIAEKDGVESLLPVARQLRDVWQRAQKESSRSELSNAEYLFKDRNSALGWLVKLPEALAAFEAGPKPAATDVVRGEDGRLVVCIALPDTPNDRGETLSFNPWWATVSPSTQWTTLARHEDGKPRRSVWLLEPQGKPMAASVTLNFRAEVFGRSAGGHCLTRWAMRVPVPAKPSVASSTDWWKKNVSDRDWRPDASGNVYHNLVRRALEAFEGGEHEEALDLYGQLLELPKDQWPEYYRQPVNKHLYATSCRTYRERILKCRAALGQIDAVLAEVVAEESKLPALDPETEDMIGLRDLLHKRTYLRSIRLAAVRYLAEHDRLDEGTDMMERIARDRPNPMDYPSRMVTVPKPGGWSRFQLRSSVQQAWREYDTVAWDLFEQTGGRWLPPVEASP